MGLIEQWDAILEQEATRLRTEIPDVTVPEGAKGPWKITRFDVPRDCMHRLRFVRDGRGMPPGTYTRITCSGRGVVMSDTPAEKKDHLPIVRRATGHVLLNGLGIGMVLGAVLRKPGVSKVTVVELEQDVIDLVAPHYADPRVEIVQADAFEYQPPKGVRYGAVWHDIWDEICEDNLPSMIRLTRKYARRSDWQGSWARDECERLRARGAYYG